MQSTTGTQLATTALAAYRRPSLAVSFLWNGSDWTDETPYVMRWDTMVESAYTDKGIAIVGNSKSGTANITLSNKTNRFSPFLTTGALYDYIGGAKLPRHKVKIYAGFYNSSSVAENLPRFVGFVKEATEDTIAQTVTLYCEDLAVELKGREIHTTTQVATTPGDWIDYIIAAVNLQLTAESRTNITTSVDAGRFSIDFAWMQGETAWEEIKAVAEADGGRVYFDHSGVLRYEDMSHVLLGAHASSVFTFTGARYAGLTHSWTIKEPPINAVTVQYFPRFIANREVIYSCGERLLIRPGETIEHKASFREPAYSVLDPVADTDYQAVTAAGFDMTSDITITATAYSKQATLSIENTGNDSLYMWRNQLRGNLVAKREMDEVEYEDATSIAQYGKNHVQISSPLIQGRRHATAIAHFTIDRNKDPKQGIVLQGIPAIPYLEVSDRVTVQETKSGTNHDCFIMRTWEGQDFTDPDNATYTQSIWGLPVTDLFPYSDYYEISRSALGTGAGKGRLFY